MLDRTVFGTEGPLGQGSHSFCAQPTEENSKLKAETAIICRLKFGAIMAKPELNKIFGKIKYVENFPDYKVKVVENFADLHVQQVSNFPNKPGQWEIVDNFPDLKIKLVESFPDFTIKFVKSSPGPQKK